MAQSKSTKAKDNSIRDTFSFLLILVINLFVGFFVKSLPSIVIKEPKECLEINGECVKVADMLFTENAIYPINIAVALLSIAAIVFILIRNKTKLNITLASLTFVLIILFQPVISVTRIGGVAGFNEKVYRSLVFPIYKDAGYRNN